MIKILNLTEKLVAATIGFAVFLLIHNPAWALNKFADFHINELKVIEVDIKSETVKLESPDGETAIFRVGDVLGREEFSITAIHDWIIELESRPDENGRIRKSGLRTNNILKIEESLPFSEP